MTTRPDPQLARRAIGLIDLTDLSDTSSVADVEGLCARAATHGTAAVCVWPDFVARAAHVLHDSGVEIATVVNFPTGDERPFAVGVLTERALADGASEIDVVMPYRAWLAGDTERPEQVLGTVRSLTTEAGAHVKVILENGMLPDVGTVDRVARYAVAHGADFIKTSTGTTDVSATPGDVEAMLAVLADADAVASGRTVGIKPSGGIRTYHDAVTYLAAADRVMGAGWARPSTFRFGASGLLDALLNVVEDA